VSAELLGSERVRTAEVIAALCLATDLGMAFPFEHGLHTTLIAMRIADRLGLDREQTSQTYYACLLAHAAARRRPTPPPRSSAAR
jgi:HD-GYP domain-containing protein (c-di-GMP phosphodiesterase class II)